jgi:hypothetical protein
MRKKVAGLAHGTVHHTEKAAVPHTSPKQPRPKSRPRSSHHADKSHDTVHSVPPHTHQRHQ